jgi:1-acyl-sn-glycerol-3-phosphate acyltransferase
MPVGYVGAVIVWLLTVLFDRRLVVLHLYSCFWASWYTWASPFWKVEIQGKEKIDRKRVYVMVSNHQSMLDILVLYRLFVHFKWVSKAELFRAPLSGWNMSMNRYIKLHRTSRASIRQMMEDSRKTLEEGSPVMIFPEGTRSTSGKVERFKEGAFRIAKDTGRPILPIVLYGTGEALPKHGLVVRGKHRMKVHILDEIPPEFFKEMTVDELTEYTRNLIIGEYEKMREEYKDN